MLPNRYTRLLSSWTGANGAVGNMKLFNNHSGLRGLSRFAEGIDWATGLSLTTPFTEGCAGANNKASPPGRHQEQAPKQRCTFSPTTFSSVLSKPDLDAIWTLRRPHTVPSCTALHTRARACAPPIVINYFTMLWPLSRKLGTFAIIESVFYFNNFFRSKRWQAWRCDCRCTHLLPHGHRRMAVKVKRRRRSTPHLIQW